MKLFVSYHLADSRPVAKIKNRLHELNIRYYSVPEDANFSGWHHQQIRDYLFERMSDCDVVLCVIGPRTFSRPHVDNEIHHALHGGAGTRKGIVAVMLENRKDSINNIDFSSFPTRLQRNIEYVVLVQNATLFDNIHYLLYESIRRSNDRSIAVDNTANCMQIRNRYYF